MRKLSKKEKEAECWERLLVKINDITDKRERVLQQYIRQSVIIGLLHKEKNTLKKRLLTVALKYCNDEITELTAYIGVVCRTGGNHG